MKNTRKTISRIVVTALAAVMIAGSAPVLADTSSDIAPTPIYIGDTVTVDNPDLASAPDVREYIYTTRTDCFGFYSIEFANVTYADQGMPHITIYEIESDGSRYLYMDDAEYTPQFDLQMGKSYVFSFSGCSKLSHFDFTLYRAFNDISSFNAWFYPEGSYIWPEGKCENRMIRNACTNYYYSLEGELIPVREMYAFLQDNGWFRLGLILETGTEVTISGSYICFKVYKINGLDGQLIPVTLEEMQGLA